MKVVWKNSTVVPCKFDDLDLGESFRIIGGRGAVYIKVHNCPDDKDMMLEIETGNLFTPTSSKVEQIKSQIIVDSNVPQCYRY